MYDRLKNHKFSIDAVREWGKILSERADKFAVPQSLIKREKNHLQLDLLLAIAKATDSGLDSGTIEYYKNAYLYTADIVPDTDAELVEKYFEVLNSGDLEKIRIFEGFDRVQEILEQIQKEMGNLKLNLEELLGA